MTIFVNSMSDLFHEDVPADYIQCVFASMTAARSWHQLPSLDQAPGTSRRT